MRNKIIAVNAAIILLVGILSYALVRASLFSAAGNREQLIADAQHDVLGAAARLQLDALRAERWLAAKVREPGQGEPFSKGSPEARGDSATTHADAILAASLRAPDFEGRRPSFVAVVDTQGRIIGRNGSTMSRGDDLGAVYPTLKEAIAGGNSASDVWTNSQRGDMYLVSIAPIRDEQGKIGGAYVLGAALNDVLAKDSDATTGRGLLLAVPDKAGLKAVARSTNTSQTLAGAVDEKLQGEMKEALSGGHALAVPLEDVIAAVAPLPGLGNGKAAVLVAEAPSSRIENPAAIANPIWGAVALGVLLVVIGGWLLGNYIDRPINTLEEGLLAILNGQQDRRFEMDHAELGGLAFRIDQLLNQLMGVEEDTTDEEGRPSKAPTAADYRPAMSVDEKKQAEAAGGGDVLDPAGVKRLAAEPPDAYYARLYGEYITAKRALGEDVSHITREAFVQRIKGMERDAQQKHGRMVRYQVKATGREVVLIAVPLL